MFLQGKKQPVQNFFTTIKYPSIYASPNKTKDAGRLEQAACEHEDLSLPRPFVSRICDFNKKTLPGFVQLSYGVIF